MDYCKGEQVLVNLAPFIGWTTRSDEQVTCDILAVEGDRVRIRTREPYRSVALWVERSWIEGRAFDREKSLVLAR